VSQPPAFQCYAKDLLADTEHLTNEEFGAYWRLVCQAWIQDGLVSDERDLIRLSRAGTPGRFRQLWHRLEVFFSTEHRTDGKLSQKRLEQTRQTQRLWREKSSKGGTAAALAKAQARDHQEATTLEPPLVPSDAPNVNSPVSSLQSPDSRPDPDPPLLPSVGAPPQGGQANGSGKKPRTARTRKVKHRLPDEWAPSDGTVAEAKGFGFSDAELEAITDEFCTHWWGDGGVKADWDMTWLNRVIALKHGGRKR